MWATQKYGNLKKKTWRKEVSPETFYIIDILISMQIFLMINCKFSDEFFLVQKRKELDYYTM